MNGTKVMVVEDEQITALGLEERLKMLGYSVCALAATGEDAIQKAFETNPEIILMDIRLSGEIDGIQAAEQIRAEVDIPIVYLTGFDDETTLQRAKKTEPYGLITKPFEFQELRATIDLAIYKHRVDQREKRLYHQQMAVNRLSLLVGDCRDLDSIYKTIHDYIQGLMDVDAFIVSFLEAETGLIRAGFSATEGIIHDAQALPAVPLNGQGGGMQSRVFVSGKPRYIPDFEKIHSQVDTIYSVNRAGQSIEGYPLGESERTTRSAIMAPLMVENQTIGVMQVQSFTREAYSQEDLDLLSSLASVASLAIHNTRLYESTQKELQQRVLAEQALRVSERKYREMVENLTEVVYRVNAQGEMTYVSPSIFAFVGYKPGEIIGRQFSGFIHPDDRPRAVQNYQNVLSGTSQNNEFRILARDGKFRWVRSSSRPVMDSEGQVEVHGVLLDITDQKVAEEKLKQSEERYRIISGLSSDYYYSVSVAPDGLMATDWIEGAFEKITGYDPGFIQQVEEWFKVIHPQDSTKLQQVFQTLLSNQAIQSEYRIHTQDGQERWLEDRIQPIWDPQSERVVRFIGAVSDITERKKTEQQLQHLATHDMVTDLPNRVLFQDRLRHAVEITKRGGFNLAVLFLDLDGFKIVNDTVGHDKGDSVLREVARRLKDCTRESDTVARFGGDEFSIILENTIGEPGVSTVARKIIAEIGRPFRVEDQEFKLTVSIGISICSQDCASVEAMMKNADIAMYQVKQAGKDGFYIFCQDETSTTDT